MIITEFEDTDLIERLGDSSLEWPTPPVITPRTRGVVHLSDIYKILMQRREPERFCSDRPMDMKRIELGLLFETALERVLAAKFATTRPGEIITPEGIHMTPDGVNPTLDAGEEYKATYMSCSQGVSEPVFINGRPTDAPLPKFYHWFVQMMGYAKWLYTNLFILRVLFVRGDYKYLKVVDENGFERSVPNEPLFKSYRCEFTDEEIETNWALLMGIAREEGLLA